MPVDCWIPPNSTPGRTARTRRPTRLLIVTLTVVVSVVVTSCGWRDDDGAAPGQAARTSTSAPATTAAPSTIATTVTTTTAPPTTATPTTATPTTATPTTEPAPSTAPETSAPGADKRLYILSDSVMLGAASAVAKALPEWTVTFDGKESRFISAGVDDLRARAGELGPFVLVQLGNNYGGNRAPFAKSLDDLYAVVGPDRTLILVKVVEFQPDRADVNAAIDALAAEHPNVRVADWPAVVRADPTIATAEGLHLKPRGAEVMADFVEQQVEAASGGG